MKGCWVGIRTQLMLRVMAILWHGCPGGQFPSRKALGPGFGDTHGQHLEVSGLWFC